MIQILGNVDGQKTLIIALSHDDVYGLLDGRDITASCAGLGVAPPQQIMITAGEAAIRLDMPGDKKDEPPNPDAWGAELNAQYGVMRALDALEPEARKRVIRWAAKEVGVAT